MPYRLQLITVSGGCLHPWIDIGDNAERISCHQRINIRNQLASVELGIAQLLFAFSSGYCVQKQNRLYDVTKLCS